MTGLRRYWETNKKKILTIVGVLAFIIFIIHFVNDNLYVVNTENESNTYLQNKEEIGPTQAIVDDSKISEETAKENTQLINQFVSYCNQGDYQSAFDILSDACQKEIFDNDLNLFIENYCDKTFGATRTYNMELWATNDGKYTYQVTFYEDNLLATGGSGANNNVEDYITIIEEEGESKLNISNFIYYEEINNTITQNDIEITVNSRKVYKTYENYNITIKNNSTNIISISTERNGEDICLIDENDVQYSSLLYEIPQHLLNIKSGYQTNIDLSFNKVYNVYRNTEKIRFQSIVLNYDENNNSDGEAETMATIDIHI